MGHAQERNNQTTTKYLFIIIVRHLGNGQFRSMRQKSPEVAWSVNVIDISLSLYIQWHYMKGVWLCFTGYCGGMEISHLCIVLRKWFVKPRHVFCCDISQWTYHINQYAFMLYIYRDLSWLPVQRLIHNHYYITKSTHTSPTKSLWTLAPTRNPWQAPNWKAYFSRTKHRRPLKFRMIFYHIVP